MDNAQIRTLTNHFCRMAKKYLKSAEELRGVHIVLVRIEDGWDLIALTGRFNRRDYVTVIDLPEDLYTESVEDAIIDLAGLISRKLTDSARAINSQRSRTKDQIRENAKKANDARWGRG